MTGRHGSWRSKASPRCAELLRPLLDQVGEAPLLTRQQEIELADAAHAGDLKARERLIMCNTRLVARVAIDKFQQAETPAFTVEDAFMAGIEGLMHAISRFDTTKGFKLSTYATWWIVQTIDRAMKKEQGTIRLPYHRWDAGERPAKLASLDVPGKDGFESPLSDSISLEHDLWRSERDLDAFMELEADLSVASLLEVLDEREREVIVLRYGLGALPPQTLEVIGKRFELTRERIRQIQREAEGKMEPLAS